MRYTGPSSGGRLDKWCVVANPAKNEVSAVFGPALADVIVRAGTIDEITIHEQDRPKPEAFTAERRDGRAFKLESYSVARINRHRTAQ